MIITLFFLIHFLIHDIAKRCPSRVKILFKFVRCEWRIIGFQVLSPTHIDKFSIRVVHCCTYIVTGDRDGNRADSLDVLPVVIVVGRSG